MLQAEVEAFSHWATSQTFRSVIAEGPKARLDWSARIRQPMELRDVAPFAQGGWFSPKGAIAAAAQVAIELGIITALWPEEANDVLRPSWK